MDAPQVRIVSDSAEAWSTKIFVGDVELKCVSAVTWSADANGRGLTTCTVELFNVAIDATTANVIGTMVDLDCAESDRYILELADKVKARQAERVSATA